MKRSLRILAENDRRWSNITSDAASIGEARNRLRTVILNLHDSHNCASVDRRFALLYGSHLASGSDDLVRTLESRLYVLEALKGCESGVQIAKVLACWFESLRDERASGVARFAASIQTVIEAAPALGIHMKRQGRTVLFYPAGARFLDQGLVDDTLQWLGPHPQTLKFFEEALTIYLSGDERKYRNLLDNLRFALEQLVRKVLGNEKSLENQKPFLLGWLKEHGLHQQVVNIFEALLMHYCVYQNAAVKHKEQYAKNEVEFMIYLTGSFMRLLLRLA